MSVPKGYERQIIFLCTFFSFFSTWRGAYKVTDWFGGFRDVNFYLRDADFHIHFLFSFYTAFIIFFILYKTLAANIGDEKSAKSESDTDNSSVSTPYILSIMIVLGLSLSLSVVGLLEGYRDYEKNNLSKIDDIVDENSKIKPESLKDAEESYVYGPTKKLLEELGKKTARYRNDSAKIESLDKEIAHLEDQEKKDMELKKQRLDILSKGISKKKEIKRGIATRLLDSKQDNSIRDQLSTLYKERGNIATCAKYSDKITVLNNYTEEISKFILGCEDDKISKFRETFYRARNELDVGSEEIQSINLEIDQNKLKKLNEKERALEKINEEKSFVEIFKSPEKESHWILIIFFALIGDVVPVLISLKHSKPATVLDVLQATIKWFHEIAKKIETIDFIPTVSRSILGFLFGGQNDDKKDDKCWCGTIYRSAMEIIRALMSILIEFVVFIVFLRVSLKMIFGDTGYKKIYDCFQSYF